MMRVMSMENGSKYTSTLVIHPRKQQESSDRTMKKGLMRGPAVDMIDFVRGSFDFVMIDEDGRSEQ
jgi:hypothetical protein